MQRVLDLQPLFKVIFLFFFCLSLLIANRSFAESRPSDTDVYGYLSQLGSITFSKSGGAFMPTAVLQSMRTGRVSPVMQFVLVNHLFNQGAKQVLEFTPAMRDPFVVALEKYNYGLCFIRKLYQQSMLLTILPELSNVTGAGGSSSDAERDASKQSALVLIQAFQKDSGCGGESDGGIDPLLISLLQQ